VAMVPLNEIEMHFVEFLDKIPHCKYPNCVHIHEDGCAVKAAVESGEIDFSRYESYVELFMDRSEQER
jgi:ribosome biogenesis GTPase / thiamine phosphate phosphatase